MNNENLDTTNKLIKPEDVSPSDDEVIKQLSDNLQDITTDDVNSMCDEMDFVRIREILRDNEPISKKLTLENAVLMINKGRYELVLKHIDKFIEAEHKQIMLKIIKYLDVNQVQFDKNKEIPFEKICGLDKEVALEILNSNNKSLLRLIVAKCYSGLDDEIAGRLIDLGYEGYVAEQIEYFPKNLKKTILLLAKEKAFASFKNLSDDDDWLDDAKFEDDLIAAKYPEMITGNIVYFPGINHKRIALKLIKAGFGVNALYKLKNFKGLDKETAIAFIDARCYHGKSLDSLCYFGYSDSSRNWHYYLDKEIAMKILNDEQTSNNQYEWIAGHLKAFKGLDTDVAMILIKKGFSGEVAYGAEYFTNLNDEIANMLIDNGYAKKVKEYESQYVGLTMKTKIRLMLKAKK